LLWQTGLSVRLSLRLSNAGSMTNGHDVTLLDGLVVNLVIFCLTVKRLHKHMFAMF